MAELTHPPTFEFSKHKLDPADPVLHGESLPADNVKTAQFVIHGCQDSHKSNSGYKTESAHGVDNLEDDESINTKDTNFTMSSTKSDSEPSQFDYGGPCLAPEVTPKQSVVDMIRKNLQLMYKKMVLPALFPWLPRRFTQLQEYLRNVKLSMLATDADGFRIDTRTESVGVGGIFQYVNGLKPTRVHIQDTVGFNSTALAVSLCRLWAADEGSVATDFDLVIFLQGYDLTKENIENLIMKTCGVDSYALLEALESNPKVLFVLDDVANVQVGETRGLLQYLRGITYAQSTVLVTGTSCKLNQNSSLSWNAPLVEVQSPHSCTKFLTIEGVSQEVESKFIHTNLPHQVKNNNDFDILITNVNPFFSNGELHNPFFLLLVIQVFSKDDIQKAKTITDAYKIIFQHLVDTYYKPAKKGADVELFDFDKERIPLVAKLLSQFGEVALLCIAENSLASKPKNIVNLCDMDDSIHDLGLFLYKETKNSSLKSTSSVKREQRFEVELIHPLLLHFTIAYHLWMVFTTESSSVFLKRLALFKTAMGQETESENSIRGFLFGLVCHKVEDFVKTLYPFSNEYGDWIKDLLYQSATAVVDFDNAFTVNHWKECQEQLTVSAHLLYTIPYTLKIKRLCLDMPGDELIQSDSITCTIQCDHLWCILRGSAEQGPTLLYFLKIIQYQDLSIVCQYSKEYSTNWLLWIHQEFLNGNMKQAHLSYLCLYVPYDLIYEAVPMLNNLVCHDIVSALSLSLLPSNSVTSVDKRNQQARFYQHIKTDLPQLVLPDQQLHMYTAEDYINSFVELAGKSNELQSIKLTFPFKSDGITVSMDHLCQFGMKCWRSVELSHCLVTSNTHIQNREIGYLDFSAVYGIESSVVMLPSYQVHSLNISTSNLQRIQHLPMYDEESLNELHIQINTINPEPDIFNALLHFRNVEILSLTLSNSCIMVDEMLFGDNTTMIYLKGIELFNAHSHEAYNFTVQLVHHLNDGASSRASSVKPIQKLKLDYLLFRLMMDKDFISGDKNAMDSPTDCCLKCVSVAKDSLKLNLLKQIQVVCKAGALSRLKLLEDIFSRQEGFMIERDFWGMKEHDTQLSKRMYDFMSMTLWHRLTITHQ